LTAECGLLSSMAGLFEFFGGCLSDTLPVSIRYWNAGEMTFSVWRDGV
jgi:hypothetical protein